MPRLVISSELLVRRRKEYRGGFTLIELLVVIAIIAILSAIAITAFSILNKNSRDARRKSDLKTIQSALEQYHSDQNFYPSGLGSGALTSDTGRPTPYPTPAKIYLQTVPQDPTTGNAYPYLALPSACINSGPTALCTSYCLYARMENSDNGFNLAVCTDKFFMNYEVTAP